MNGADKTDIDVAAILGLDEGQLAAYRVVTPDPHPPHRWRRLAIWACSIVVLVLLAASGASTLRINGHHAPPGGAASRYPGTSPETLGAYAFTLAPPAPIAQAPTASVAALPAPTKPQRPGSLGVHDVRVARVDANGRAHATEETRRVWRMSERSGAAQPAIDRAAAEQFASRAPSASNTGRAIVAQAGSLPSRRLERAERVEAIDAISLLRQK